MLEIDSLSKQFFGLRAVDQVSTRIAQGQITAIIGPLSGPVRKPCR